MGLGSSEGLGRTALQTDDFTALMLPQLSLYREEGTRDLAVPRKFAAPDPRPCIAPRAVRSMTASVARVCTHAPSGGKLRFPRTPTDVSAADAERYS